MISCTNGDFTKMVFDHLVIGDNFSADGSRIAQLVKQREHQYVAVDDLPSPPFDRNRCWISFFQSGSAACGMFGARGN